MLPGPFAACFLYAVRVCIPPRRLALLAVPMVGAVLLGLLAHAIESGSEVDAFNDVSEGLFGLVLPFACLVVGDAVLGAERRSGALALTWLSPTPFTTIVLARWLAGWVVATGALVPAMVAAAVVAGAPEAAGALVVAAVASSGAYVALFVLVGAAAQRAALWSLAIVMLGERLLGNALAGIAQLSPQWLARTTYAGLGPDADELLRSGVPSGWDAVARLALVAAVGLVLAVRQVRRLQLAGAAD